MHYREFRRIWDAFLKQDEPYVISVRVYPDGGGAIYVDAADDFPRDELSLEFGELLYQLRAAMDSLIYEVAILDNGGQDPPPNAEELEFPIRTSQGAFDRAARKLAPLSDLHREMVESVQPYDLDDKTEGMRVTAEVLQEINDLARKDRHRGLRVIGSWGSNRNPQLDPPAGCGVEWLKTTPDGLLEHQSEVARFKLRNWRVGLELQANPNLAIDVTLEDARPPRSDEDTLHDRTRWMLSVMAVVIESFEETLG